MKTTAKKIARDENGKILILVLVLLVVGGLLLGPLLGLMSTGLVAGQVYEKKASELYAADAGVEEAVWHISTSSAIAEEQFIVDENEPEKLLSRLYEEYGLGELWSDGVNEKEVEVMVFTISKGVAGGRYKITSTANTPGDGRTTVEAWVDHMPGFWDNAITTPDEIYLKEGTVVEGNTAGTLTGPGGKPKGEVTGEPRLPWDPESWPFNVDYREFYVDNADPSLPRIELCTNYSLDVATAERLGPAELGSDSNKGVKVLVESSDNKSRVPASLSGTLYVSGSDNRLVIGAGGNSFDLDLNMGTIFVEGVGVGSGTEALRITDKVYIKGSGVIIAVGDIYFAPNLEFASSEDFIFLMSLNGSIQAQPGATFYGSMAARWGVEIKQGGLVHYTDPPLGLLNFPSDPTYNKVFIRTWNVS